MKLTDTVSGLLRRRSTASSDHGSVKRFPNWQQITQYWNNEWQQVSRTRFYIAAGTATVFMVGSISTFAQTVHHTQAWNRVFENGAYVGLVPNEPQVTEAMKRVALGYHVNVSFEPVHTNVPGSYDWKTVQSLPTSAVAIQLNGKTLAYTADRPSAKSVLTSIRNALLPKQLQHNANVNFVGDVALSSTVVAISKITSPLATTRLLLNPSGQVVAGRSSTLHFISRRGQSVNSPKESGTSASSSSLTMAKPLIQVQATETVDKVVTMPSPVHYVDNSHLSTSTVRTVKQGSPGEAKQHIQLRFLNGKLVTQTVLQQKVLRKPAAAIVERGTNSGVAEGSWGWPTTAYDITSGFGPRVLGGRYEFHPGVDIGCSIGTPIYATNNGVVEEAGWNNGGYGYWVLINNGNGIETVFGHMSSVVAQSGQLVTKGELIGYSGSTGEATGPHLHYEVRQWGRPVNPSPYM